MGNSSSKMSLNKTLLYNNITQSTHINLQIVFKTLYPLPCAHCLRFTEHALYVDGDQYAVGPSELTARQGSDEPQPLARILNEVYDGDGQIFFCKFKKRRRNRWRLGENGRENGREWEKEWGAVPMQTAHDLWWGKFLQI